MHRKFVLRSSPPELQILSKSVGNHFKVGVRETLVTKGKTLVTEGKALVNWVTEGKKGESGKGSK